MKVGQPFNPHGMFRGAWIPEALLRFPGLSANAKLVYARLARFKGKSGEAIPSQGRLAREVGASTATVKRAVEELEGQGFIRRHTPTGEEMGERKTCRYDFLWHPVFDADLCCGATDETPTQAQNDHTLAQNELGGPRLKMSQALAQNEPQRESFKRVSKRDTQGGKPPADLPGQKAGEKQPYVIKTPVQAVMVGFKMAMGIEREDRGWDEAYFGRYSKDAQALLKFFKGDVGRCLECIEGVANHFKKIGMPGWGPRGIVNNATQWAAGTLGK